MSINNPSQSGKIGKATGGTSGSILFVDSSGNLAQDNSNLFWDDTNNLCYISSPTFSARKAYLTVRNASNYPEASLTQGLAAGYGGILALYDGTTAGGTGSIRLEYNVGYPQMITTSNNFTFTTSAGGLTFASTYIQQSISGNVYYLATSDQAGNKFTAGAASQKVVVVQGRASQSANLQEWQDSSGTQLAYVTKDGQIYNNVQAAVANLYLANAYNSDCINVSKTGGTGNVLTAALVTSQSHGIYMTNTSAGTYLQGGNQYGVYSQTSHACDNPAVIAGNFIAAHTATASGTYGHLAIGVNASAASSMSGGTYGAAGKFTCASANVAGIQVVAHASQTSNLQEWQNSGGTAVSYIRPDGSLKPASLADGSAVNDSIYYSTTASKLVYKDSGGTVNALY